MIETLYKNKYGNYHLQQDCGLKPENQEVVMGARLQPLCRKLNIEYVETVDWSGRGKWIKASTVGVLIKKSDVPALREAIKKRDEKASARKLQERRKLQKKAAARLELLNASWDSFHEGEKRYYKDLKLELERFCSKEA